MHWHDRDQKGYLAHHEFFEREVSVAVSYDHGAIERITQQFDL
jgi:hypothetical protein